MNRAIIFVATLLLASTGMAQQGAKNDAKDKGTAIARNTTMPAEGASQAASAATTDPAYVIGPEDMLDISVWKEPDVSRLVPEK